MRVLIWILLIAVGGRVCSATGSSTEEAFPDRVTFHSGVLQKEIVLEGGEFSEPAAPGSASQNMVRIVEMVPAGLHDGRKTRILVLGSETGGSGTYIELALMAFIGEGWKITDSLLLGDRVRVEGIEVSESEVAVNILAHGENDPQCCPTKKSTRKFHISSLHLVAADDP